MNDACVAEALSGRLVESRAVLAAIGNAPSRTFDRENAMDGVDLIRRMWAHAAWADATLLEALTRGSSVSAEAWREYAHILAAEAVWLARLEQRPAPVPVWPTLTSNEVAALRGSVVAGYDAYLAQLDAATLLRTLTYRTSTGQEFTSVVHDVLVHVALHGQYHRGKINLLLRQRHCEPGPVDYIGFVRGVPAAVTPNPDSSASDIAPNVKRRV